MTAAKYDDATDGMMIRVLGKHREMVPALAEISANLGRKVTRDAVNHRLRAQGLGSAHDNLLRDHDARGVRVRESAPANDVPRVESSELERILFIPDAHIPHEDKVAFDLMLEAARDFRPHTVVCLGDLGDFNGISQHSKGPGDAPSLIEELHAINRRLDQIDALGARRKVITLGNHEYRWDTHLAMNAPEFAGLCDLKQWLRFKERGWEVTNFHDFTRIGKLYASHCLNNRTFGKNAHRAAQSKFGGSVVLGHTHRMTSEYIGSVTGKSWVTASFGWLGDRDSLAVHYAARADRWVDWQTGWGCGYMELNGTVHIQAIPVIDGRCVMNGKLYGKRASELAKAA